MGVTAEALGNLGDTEAATQILADDFVFPPDCDPATRALVQEAARIKLEFQAFRRQQQIRQSRTL